MMRPWADGTLPPLDDDDGWPGPRVDNAPENEAKDAA